MFRFQAHEAGSCEDWEAFKGAEKRLPRRASAFFDFYGSTSFELLACCSAIPECTTVRLHPGTVVVASCEEHSLKVTNMVDIEVSQNSEVLSSGSINLWSTE